MHLVEMYVFWSLIMNLNKLICLFSALCELFDKADTGGDGTISIQEYIAMCDEYGIAINEEHIESVKAIANENGEVKKSNTIFIAILIRFQNV